LIFLSIGRSSPLSITEQEILDACGMCRLFGLCL